MDKNDEILTEKLEELNKEYLDSGYYDLGKYIKTIMKLLKGFHFISVFRLFILHLKKKKNKSNVVEEKPLDNQTNKYVIKNETGKKIAIYTCITGSYDKVEEPLVIESRV